MKKLFVICIALTLILSGCTENNLTLSPNQKDATKFTSEYNQNVKSNLNTESVSHENELASKGLIATTDGLNIKHQKNGTTVWDLTQYQFLVGESPDTVNPKLWEHAKINMHTGLFQVSDNIYQVRGYDLANITFIRGTSGWIVIDPLTAQETSKAAYDFITKALNETRNVSAVIYTHSHVDHYAGVLGIADENTKIYAPDGFMDAVVSENLYAGTAMSRRSFYMYGTTLESGPKGQVDGGLGKKVSLGTQGLKAPDITITESVQTLTLDGLEMTFQLTNGTEAPSEMNVYIPSENSLCIAENCTATLHNLYTLRGAEIRDPEKWADYLDQTIALFGDKANSIFSTHNWPRSGDEIVPYIQSQRDCYQYIKDQTLRLMSLGYTMDEVGRMVTLPKSLSDSFFNGEFYGTVSHNAKGVYQKYLGWYDSNPVNLNKLLPEDSAKKYIEYMGGSDAVLQMAKKDFNKGDYQWVAEVTKQILFDNPDNTEAKYLCADALEQLGYIAESGPWRNEYLAAADELRNGVHLPGTGIQVKPDVYDALNAEQLTAMLAIRLNGERSEGVNLTFTIKSNNLTIPLQLRNSVLVYLKNSPAVSAFTVEMDKNSLYNLVSGATGDINYTIYPQEKTPDFENFLSMLDTSDPHFNIVTP